MSLHSSNFQSYSKKKMTVQNESKRRYSLFVYIETVDSVEGALRLANQTPNILCFYVYRRATQEKMPYLFASVTSEEIIQIDFLRCILSHCFSTY